MPFETYLYNLREISSQHVVEWSSVRNR